MQCVRKRSLDADCYVSKRVCLGPDLQVRECPMETSHASTPSNQQLEEPGGAARSRPRQLCPRCLGGEPGHINHIMKQ